MAGDVTKAVNIRIDATTTGNAKSAFTGVAGEADKAEAAIKKMDRATKDFGTKVEDRLGSKYFKQFVALLNPLTIGLTAIGAGFALIKSKADEAAASLAAFQAKSAAITLAGTFGSLEGSKEQTAAQKYAIAQPFRERVRSLGEERAGLLDQNDAARRYQQRPFEEYDRTQALTRAGERVQTGLTGPGGLNTIDVAKGLESIRKVATGEIKPSADTQRGTYVAGQASIRAQADYAKQQQDLEATQKSAELTAAYGKFRAAEDFQRERGKDVSDLSGFGGHINQVGMEASGKATGTLAQRRAEAQATYEAAQQNTQQRASEFEAAQGRLPGSQMGATQDAVLRKQQELAAASDRLRAAEQARLQAIHAQNTAYIDQLKSVHQQVDAQAKLFGEIKKQAQAELDSKKAGLGLMSGDDKLKALAVSQTIQQKGKMNEDEIAFAQQHQDLFGDALRKQGMATAATDPMTKEILANLGADAKVTQAAKAEKEAIQVAAELKTKIEIAVKADDQIGAQLRTDLVPKIEEAMQKAVESMIEAIQQAVFRKFEQQEKQRIETAANGRQIGGG